MLENIAKVYDDIDKLGKEGLKLKLSEIIGHEGFFSDDVWICKNYDGYNGYNKKEYSLSFLSTPNSFREILKLFILRNSGRSHSTYKNYISMMNQFLKFSIKNFSLKSLRDVSYYLLEEYKAHLIKKDLVKGRKEHLWRILKQFFGTMSVFPEVPKIQFPPDPDFKEKENPEIVDNIDPDVFREIDKVFVDYTNSLPTHVQLIYWILRLIPSRINEVLEMKIETCLRTTGDKYIVTIPVPKNSPLYKIKTKMIYLTGKSAVEEHLLNLFNKQIKISKGLQSELIGKGPSGFLFTAHRVNGHSTIKKTVYSMTYVEKYSDESFNSFLKTLIKNASKVMDESNAPKYKLLHNIVEAEREGTNHRITSHKLRGEGISDRLDNGFKIQDVMFLSGLNSANTIWDSYYQSSPDRSVQPSEPIFKTDGPNTNDEVMIKISDINFEGVSDSSFQGTVVDDILLELNQEIYRQMPIVTSSGVLLGNCAGDYYKCKKIKNELQCLECDFCKNEDPETVTYLEKAIERFKSDIEFFKDKGNKISRKIAKDRLSIYEKLLERILANNE
ncbi:hypothetical protein [Natranaerobius trueperi]|uniref:Core-binding (CB) domain-containing protein n=1 Tax=Natranaerobius trueperi TaxID=759412 RepID=A0A226BZ16_9FIRM|nr:hypothetical protein [Natranaerobius trueperi]OWZ84288.1 hypothetical protein CDO51_04310 [Natranaerobius trueperi]